MIFGTMIYEQEDGINIFFAKEDRRPYCIDFRGEVCDYSDDEEYGNKYTIEFLQRGWPFENWTIIYDSR